MTQIVNYGTKREQIAEYDIVIEEIKVESGYVL
jgi:hypothetical protein